MSSEGNGESNKLQGGPEGGNKALIFPLPASEHGTSMITYTVGARTEWPARTFTVHKNLLCRASEYFRKSLNGRFKERSERELELLHDCPAAFDVLYNWVYTGFFYEETNPESGPEPESDLYCLELYKFADCRLIPHLKEHVILVLSQSYNTELCFLPCSTFLERLFGIDDEHTFLRDYFVGHIAFLLSEPDEYNNYEQYEEIFEACEGNIAQQVALKLASWYSCDSQATRCHPCDEPAFQDARAQAIRLGYAMPGSVQGSKKGSKKPEIQKLQVQTRSAVRKLYGCVQQGARTGSEPKIIGRQRKPSPQFHRCCGIAGNELTIQGNYQGLQNRRFHFHSQLRIIVCKNKPQSYVSIWSQTTE